MLKTSESVNEIFKAMISFNTAFKGLTSDANNPFFKSKYISFDSIVGLRNELAKEGLVMIQSVGSSDDLTSATICTTIAHSSGQWIMSDTLTVKPVKADPQGLGSVISYGKRYQAAAMLGIAEAVDDDGNSGSGLNNTPAGQANLNRATQNMPPTQATATQPPTAPAGMTEDQAQRMTAAIKGKGLTREQAIKICKDLTGKDGANQLSSKEAEAVIHAYENYSA